MRQTNITLKVIIWSINYACLEYGYGDCCRHGNEGLTANKNPVKSLSESKTGYQMGNKWLNMICWIICDHKRRCHQLVLSGYKQPLKHPVPPIWPKGLRIKCILICRKLKKNIYIYIVLIVIYIFFTFLNWYKYSTLSFHAPTLSLISPADQISTEYNAPLLNIKDCGFPSLRAAIISLFTLLVFRFRVIAFTGSDWN